MGLDIYFYKIKNIPTENRENVAAAHKYNTKQTMEKVAATSKKVLAKLKKLVGTDAYAEEYNRIFTKVVPKLTPYQWKYEKMLEGAPKTFEEVKEWWDKFVSCYYPNEDAYFRKVNFIYQYFRNKLDDECCFVTKADLEDLISRLSEVNNSWNKRKVASKGVLAKAKTLLPTTSGFFFGSTDYDEWYFEDVKDALKQFKHLLKDFDEETDCIYVVMSW